MTVKTALIGYTGFVGSNIAAVHDFTDCYNTTNISDIRGRSYDLVVSAATRADSHRINQNGHADLAEIDDYIGVLSRVHAAQLVLISTVCIYPGGTSPDESTPLSADGLTPYGANRLHMEQSLSERFNTLVTAPPAAVRDRPEEGDRLRPAQRLSDRIHPARGPVPVLRSAAAVVRYRTSSSGRPPGAEYRHTATHQCARGSRVFWDRHR